MRARCKLQGEESPYAHWLATGEVLDSIRLSSRLLPARADSPVDRPLVTEGNQ